MLLERSSYALWRKKGRSSAEELVNEKLNRIRKTHTAIPLGPGVPVKLEKILEQAEAREKRS